jgi:NADH-quinone oxidoreductase subunit L
MSLAQLPLYLGPAVLIAPALLFLLLGGATLCRASLSESLVARATQLAVTIGLVSVLTILCIMLATGQRHIPIELGNWVMIDAEHFHFHLKFVFDRLSVPFTIVTFMLIGTVGAFANRYLHREEGYNRFYLFYSMFLLGMTLASLAETIESLFLGWELVGLSSALLVAYFHDRPSPVINGQRVWCVYRIADAAFLLAAVALHNLYGEGDLSVLTGAGEWPHGIAELTPNQALWVGLLLIVAAAGKSGLIPFSGWLPRAMEGPTPSSAVFYGALSVHLGTYLLLRVSPIIELSVVLQVTLVVLGLSTALLGAMSASVQADVKSALALSSLTQVGIITAEIGMGLRYVALIHMVGHAFLRTLQLLRAPSLLRDYRVMENAIGTTLSQVSSRTRGNWFVSAESGLSLKLYRIAFERGMLDALLDRYIARPFLQCFRKCDQLERAWCQLLAGSPDRVSPPSEEPHSPATEELE